LLLWFESNGSHRHLRVTLFLVHRLKCACGDFSRDSPTDSFGDDRKAWLSVARRALRFMPNLRSALFGAPTS